MALDPNSQLAARLQFYRDLGIYDFYRREVREVTGNVSASDEVEASAMPSSVATSAAGLFEAASPESRAADPTEALRIIREDLGECTRCPLHRGRKQIVFGVGNPRAELMFVGEGPGADEDEQGEPFVGRAGQLLTKMIEAMGPKREDVYIANVVKCRPPSNRTPEREECDTCSPYLLRQIAAIRPKVIVALGAVAARTLLQMNEAMARLRGHWYQFLPHGGGEPIKLAVTYHPAYLLRDPRQKVEAWKDLQMVMKELGLGGRKGPE